jgi:hypothetical protein
MEVDLHPFTILRAMSPRRCPYCVDCNGRKTMVNRLSHSICLRCGHVVLFCDPDYECRCNQCMEMRLQFTIFQTLGWTSVTLAV